MESGVDIGYPSIGLLEDGIVERNAARICTVGEVRISIHHEGRICLREEGEHRLHRHAHVVVEFTQRWRVGVPNEVEIVRGRDFQFSVQLQIDESFVEVDHCGDKKSFELRRDCQYFVADNDVTELRCRHVSRDVGLNPRSRARQTPC